MNAQPRGTKRNLLGQYHRIAHDALLGDKNEYKSSNEALLSAAEAGQVDRVFSLLERPNLVSVNCHDKLTGDTPLILAARNGHREVVTQLLDAGADITVQNENGETALEVAMDTCKDMILDALAAENAVMKNQTLLQAAWAGDAVTVKKCLDGQPYIDINCHNSDGMTPLLLATRDLSLFEQIQDQMQTQYNPVEVLKELLAKQADVSITDKEGHSPLHLITDSNTESIHAQRMITLLLDFGCSVDGLDRQLCAPIHTASRHGYCTMIVALLDGGADVNCVGGDNMDTPLVLSSREGHYEASEVLLNRNADVTMVNESGETALSVAKSNNLKHIIKEAWVEQTKCSQSSVDLMTSGSNQTVDTSHDDEESSDQVGSPDSLHSGSHDPPSESHDLMSPSLANRSCFITQANTSLPSPPGDLMTDIGNHGDISYHGDILSYNSSHDTHYHGDDETDCGYKQSKQNTSSDNCTLTSVPTTQHSQHETQQQQQQHSQQPQSQQQQQQQHKQSSKQLSGRRPSLEGMDHVITAGRLKRQQSNEDKSKTGGGGGGVVGAQQVTKTRHVSRRKQHYGAYRSQSGSNLYHDNSTTPAQRLPVVKSCSAIPQKSSKGSAHVTQLPSILSNAQPVSMVAVEMDKEAIRMRQWPQSRSRSKSLLERPQQAVSKRTPVGLTVSKRYSTGSIPVKELPAVTKEQSLHHSKVSFFPNVVTPQLASHHTSSNYGNQKGRLLPLQPVHGTPSIAVVSSHLSPLHETLETYQSDKSGSSTDTPDTLTGSVTKTTKVTEDERFSDDSLEGGGVPVDNLRPPLPHNIVINHAFKDGSQTLSPIWHMCSQLPAEEDSSSSGNSEYITSYIGRQTPQPHLHPPQSPTSIRRPGDSGQGESDSEHDSSDDTDNDELTSHELIKWKKGRLIGKGAFGKVWEGLMESAKLIAVKEVELDTENDEKAKQQFNKLQLEVDILRSLDHRNIVSYLGTSMKCEAVYIFMEYIAGGSIQSLVRRFGPQHDRQIQHYTKQILKGLNYLHFNGIIHRDIKGANIMVTHKGLVKLIDFGCAKRYYEHIGASNVFHSVRGTPFWMAPEVICGQGYGRRSDIWSTGCTVYEMATTHPPWGDLPPEAAMFQIGIGRSIPNLPDQSGSSLKEFYQLCLTRDPSKRPTAHDLLETKFMTHPP